jgi:hypothetical protein
VLPRGGIFLGKWRSSFVVISNGKKKCPISLRSEHPIRSVLRMSFRHLHL